MMTDLDGRAAPANFTFGEHSTEVNESCSVLFKGIAYIFGGSNQTKQISRVENCGLIRVGGLDFDFKDGACAATASKIYLCFRADMDFKSCQTGNDPIGRPSFEHIAESNFEHQYTRIAAGLSEVNGFRETCLTLY